MGGEVKPEFQKFWWFLFVGCKSCSSKGFFLEKFATKFHYINVLEDIAN